MNRDEAQGRVARVAVAQGERSLRLHDARLGPAGPDGSPAIRTGARLPRQIEDGVRRAGPAPFTRNFGGVLLTL